jgi:HEPN domain-containing protein
VQKAESDYRLAVRISRGRERFYDELCFHCQQSAEKFSKALLEERAQYIPKTHNLADLLGLLAPSLPKLRSLRRGLLFLTDFAVETRYPGANASKRQSQAALRWAGRTRETRRALLGLPPPRPRRR